MKVCFSHLRYLIPCFAAVVFSITGCATKQKQTAHNDFQGKRPNILLIMADDMGFSDIGCYGGEIRTPNLDKLSSNGLKFSQFYNTSRCCPTRASLLTGLYPHQAGIGHMTADRGYDSYRGELSDQAVTIAEVLKEAGYATFMSGKWHVTAQTGHWSGDQEKTSRHNWPLQRGFERFFGTILGAGSFFQPVSLTEGNNPIEQEAEDFYYTDQISWNAVRYIREFDESEDDKPFFGYVAYTAPHWPLHALQEDIEKYKGRYDIGWDSLRLERLKRMVDIHLVQPEWLLTERDKEVPAWENEENKAWQAKRMEVYAAMVDRMDQGIGQMLASLEEEGELDNTLIFFLADNGGCAEELSSRWKGLMAIPDTTAGGRPVTLGNEHRDLMPGPEEVYQSYGIPWANVSNTPFRLYKHHVHEGGISSPLIINWPAGLGAQEGWNDTPAHLIDIMATCVELAEAEYPRERKGKKIFPMEGISLVPAMQGKPLDHRTIFFEHEGNSAVRKGKWKLVRLHKQDWELYNMERDRTEIHNLIGEFPKIAEELKKEYDVWAGRVNVLPWPVNGS